MRLKSKILSFIVCFVLFSSVIGICIGKAQDKDVEKLFRKTIHQPFYLRIAKLKELYGRYIMALPDSTVGKTFENLIAVAQQADDKALALEMKLIRIYYKTSKNKVTVDKAVQTMHRIAATTSDKSLWAVQMRALKQEAKILWKNQLYERMFRAFMPLKKLIGEAQTDYSPPRATRAKLTGSAYSNMAEAYMYFENYTKAIHYLKKAIVLPLTQYNVYERMRAWNNLGLCYKRMGDFKRSSYYLKKIINYRPRNEVQPLYIAIAGETWDIIIIGWAGSMKPFPC